MNPLLDILNFLTQVIFFVSVSRGQMAALPAWNQCAQAGQRIDITTSQNYQAPAGCTQLRFEVWGAGGGGGGSGSLHADADGGNGGAGAQLSFRVVLTGHPTLENEFKIRIGNGGGGGLLCGVNVGGELRIGGDGGGGGGLTEIEVGSNNEQLAQVAGGGGGGGGDNSAGNATKGGRGGAGGYSSGEGGSVGYGNGALSAGKGASSTSGGDRGTTLTDGAVSGGFSPGNGSHYSGGRGGSYDNGSATTNAGLNFGGNGGLCGLPGAGAFPGGGGGGAGRYGGGGGNSGQVNENAASGAGGGSSFLNTVSTKVRVLLHDSCDPSGQLPSSNGCSSPPINPGSGTNYGAGGNGGQTNGVNGNYSAGSPGGSGLVVIYIEK